LRLRRAPNIPCAIAAPQCFRAAQKKVSVACLIPRFHGASFRARAGKRGGKENVQKKLTASQAALHNRTDLSTGYLPEITLIFKLIAFSERWFPSTEQTITP